MNRADLQALADVRADEARALLNLPVPMPDGAYYLAGYAVECALKACIAKTFVQYAWPDKQFVNRAYTHDVEDLLELARLEAELDADRSANSALDLNWTTVKEWSERSRYERHTEVKARAMVNAVTDSTNGVLPWLRAHW